MDELMGMMKELKLSPEQMQQLGASLKTNPMAALEMIRSFKLSPELIQNMMTMFFSQPQLLMEMAEKAGLSAEVLQQVKDKWDLPLSSGGGDA